MAVRRGRPISLPVAGSSPASGGSVVDTVVGGVVCGGLGGKGLTPPSSAGQRWVAGGTAVVGGTVVGGSGAFTVRGSLAPEVVRGPGALITSATAHLV